MTVVTKPQTPLLGKLRIEGTIVVVTGLHVGGSGDTLDIGGLDKVVVRDPLTRRPYIPGSSLKGKLRSILERLFGKPVNRGGGGIYRYESDDWESGYTQISLDKDEYVEYTGAKDCPVSRVFGSTGSKCWIQESVAQEQGLDSKAKKEIGGKPHVQIQGRNHPARLIVRDSLLTETSAAQLEKIDTGLYMTEWKFENGIDRITSAANPRQLERVAAGSEFKFEMVYTVEDREQALEDLQNLAMAIAIIEDDALGGHGSRGYGKVKFQDFRFYYRGLEQYRQISSGGSTNLAQHLDTPDTGDTQKLLEHFGNVRSAVDDAIGRSLSSSGEENS